MAKARRSYTDSALAAEYRARIGQTVAGYGGADRVLAVYEGDEARALIPWSGWAVRVQHVDGSGATVERPRTHCTPLDREGTARMLRAAV